MKDLRGLKQANYTRKAGKVISHDQPTFLVNRLDVRFIPFF